MADLWPITLGGILMDNEPDADGVRWRALSLEGWDTQVVNATDSDRTSGHGGYGTRRRYPAKVMTLNGRAHCPDWQTAFDLAERIPGVVAPDATEQLIVHEPVAKMLNVDLGTGEVRASRPHGPMFRVNFQIPLTAFDPFKRAVAATTIAVAAGQTISHTADGRKPGVSEIEVTLTSAGTVDLTIGGLRLRAGSLPSGAVLTSGEGFANPKRTIRSSTGGNLFGAIVQPMQWPAMVPGVNSIHQAGTAGLSIRYFPTYA